MHSEEKPIVLKYLFEVEWVDGTIYKQTSADKSVIDPEKRSEFYDVLQAVEAGKVIRRFSLVGGGNRITVDLGTGIFYVNGLPVLLESEKLPVLPDKFDLKFYRQHTHTLNVTYSLGTGKQLKSEPGDHFIEYFIGWECTIKGKTYTQKLAVS